MEYPSPGHATRQVSVSEASRELNKSPETVRRWIKSGRLQAERVIRPQGTVWLVTLPATSPRGVGAVTPVTTPHATFTDGSVQESEHAASPVPSPEALQPSPTPATPVNGLLALAATVRQQSETIARLTRMLDGVMAELAALTALHSPVDASGVEEASDLTTELTMPWWRPW